MTPSARAPYQLSLPEGSGRLLAGGWLLLALFSLVGSGLVVVLVMLARVPVIQDFIPMLDSFRTALVVHVDLSVLVWFLAFAAFLGSLNLSPRTTSTLGVASLTLAGCGALSITLSPLFGGQPFINNYVLVLENGAFFIGTGLFSAGITGAVCHVLLASRPDAGWRSPLGAMQFGLKSGLAIFFLVALAWLWTYIHLPERMEGEHFYEVLFWGGGHLLQFTHTQLVVLAWLWLGELSDRRVPLSPSLVGWLFLLGAAPALAGPLIYALYEVDSPELREAFSTLMRHGNALAAVPVGLAVLYALVTSPRPAPAERPAWLALLFSLLLFAGGGLLGHLIDGVNTIIPAHYHGSIVAVTLAYMGLTYHLLPRLGAPMVMLPLATWQPVLYGLGQIFHMTGLAWGGRYGVQRKTAGAAQALQTVQEHLAMSLMGIGGAIAILAGALFLVITLRAIWLAYRQRSFA